jgi:GTP cyclohydrolase I
MSQQPMIVSVTSQHHHDDAAVPVSERIRARLQQAKQRFHANDNIAAFVAPGELDALLDELVATASVVSRGS